jgi:hypothetical protein
MDKIQHTGVKGMRWGVRRDSNRPGGADGKEESEKVVDKRGKIKKTLDSMKREREWGKVLREVDKMTTKDINTVKKRIDLENNLKSLRKSKMATKKDKADYLRREFMSDAEISRKVNRLQAKENLHKSVKSASKEQREFGYKVAQTAGSLGVRYVLEGGRPSGTAMAIAKTTYKDAHEIWKNNPKDHWDKSEGKVLDKVGTKSPFAADGIKFLLNQHRAKNKEKK